MGTNLGNLAALVVIVIAAIVSFFSVNLGAIVLALAAYGSFAFVLLSEQSAGKVVRGSVEFFMLTKVERAAYLKYHVFIRTPGAGQMLSAFLNLLRLAGIVWGLLSFWKGEYGMGVVLIAYFFVVGTACLRFDPVRYMTVQARKGHDIAREQLLLIQLVQDTRAYLKDEASAGTARPSGGPSA